MSIRPDTVDQKARDLSDEIVGTLRCGRFLASVSGTGDAGVIFTSQSPFW